MLLGLLHSRVTEILQLREALHQQKFRLHHMRQPCILTQATSALHPERPEHPDVGYAPWLHPVLGHHPSSLPQHPDRFNNTTPHRDALPPNLLLNLSSGIAYVSSDYQPSQILKKGLITAKTIRLVLVLSEKATVPFILSLR